MVEPQIVDLVVAGSSPVFHPEKTLQQEIAAVFFTNKYHAPVAQLDRASDFESAGCRFKSCREH